MKGRFKKDISGLTLLETLVGVAIIAIIAFSIYRAFGVIIQVYVTSRIKIAAANVAGEQMELIRNLPYQSVGTVGGIPAGAIPQVQTKDKDGLSFSIVASVRNIDDPFDGTLGGSPNDTAPADYKLVDLVVSCVSCPAPQSFEFTGRFAPKNLETSSANGALFIQVIDASGEPVSGANVTVANANLSPQINLTDVTDSTGFLKIVDTPPSAQSYHISVSKPGYSSDSTYATSTVNPNPIKPDATVAVSTVTQITLAIDRVSVINASSVTESCSAVPNFNFSLTGAKLIGTTPNLPKFSANLGTDSSGSAIIPSLEWDSYSFAYSNLTYDVRGTIPNAPLNLSPSAAQSFRIVAQPKNPLALLVTVKDAATLLPLANTSATLTNGTYSNTLVTGRGFWRQTDWSGGPGQSLFINANQYAGDDGNIENLSPAGEVKLKQVTPGVYASSGYLASSIFDTGSASNFYDFMLSPIVQPVEAGSDSLKFQIATATTSSPASWNFLGPDGTAGTFYTAATATINPVHNGDRYMRYQAYLTTASTTYTPNLSDIALTFASECVPPGQVLFSGLSSDTYTLNVSLSNYQPYTGSVTVNQGWQEAVVLLNP